MYNEKTIGERIARLRDEKRLSRTQLSEIMAVSVQAVGKWERGESLPDIITLRKLADILGIDINDFFSERETDLTVINEESEAAQKILKPEWDMSAANWKDADFSGLKNIADKFKSTNVINCKFCGSDLSGITFKANNIKGCDFSNADLSNGRLSMSNIPNNNFSGCNFRKTVIKMCDVHGCDFKEADFSDAEINGTAFNKNNLKGVKLSRTRFVNSVFSDIVIDSGITDCSFVGCSFKNTEFKGVTFRNTFFKNQKMKKAKFTGCKADKISYSFLKHSDADLSGVELIEE